MPSFMDQINTGLLGPTTNYGGIIDPAAEQQARDQAKMAMYASLLGSGGWSPNRTTLGQAVGGAMQAGQQAQQSGLQAALNAQLMKARLQNQNSLFGAVQPDKFTPESIAKFEKSGKYSDLVLRPIGMQTGRYNPGDFTPESWAAFLSTQDPAVLVRYVTPQNASVTDINGAPTLVQPDKTGKSAPRITPLTTAEAQREAAMKLKQAEAEGSAAGTGAGNVTADIIKKGNAAANVTDLLDIAEPLIAVSTGSAVGNVADKVAGFFGKSLDGATAIAKLRTLSGSLIAQMPRMEGPQSDADRLLYQQAAGDIANPNVPQEQRLAASQTIRQLQEKWKQKAAAVSKPSNKAAPAGKVVNWSDLP